MPARLTVRPLYAGVGSGRPSRSAAAGLAGTAACSEAVRNGDLGRVVPFGYQTAWDGNTPWYQWSAVLRYQRRISEALDVPIDRGFVWDPSG